MRRIDSPGTLSFSPPRLDSPGPYTTVCATGPLPAMARRYVGANLAESFCERIISCANQVMTKGNTLLDDDELQMIVMLRMNRPFMEYMRREHKPVMQDIAKQLGTVATADGRTLKGIRIARQIPKPTPRFPQKDQLRMGPVQLQITNGGGAGGGGGGGGGGGSGKRPRSNMDGGGSDASGCDEEKRARTSSTSSMRR